MDSLVLISLIGIIESCKPSFNQCNGLQIWARRHKPSSSASEISIPDRDSDFQLPKFLKAALKFAHLNFTTNWSKFKYGLPMLNLKDVLLFKRWCQPSSSGTEIRCHRCLSIDDALTAVVWILPYFSRMSVATNANTLPTRLRLFDDKSHHA
ncbi:hypothetical protein [Nodularia sphaerocarpa]|uniref:hypothetical protein n=1 Tax=Nodularia sphaerocarpa TaxID=137816 RepID=UPI001EFB76F2|nr:hypothetical protein [Nodularia sphaerocarpa]MDB9374436.1 hypothetical protein [Nodularia sphaerocarpa CS-585]ULP72392.1 hypothetical protein BDGGKGIB_02034 [Nodularia sphaerocarpa UHCC 0038]